VFAVFFPLIFRSLLMLSAILCNEYDINKPIFYLLFFQLRSICNNRTQIEDWIIDKVLLMAVPSIEAEEAAASSLSE